MHGWVDAYARRLDELPAASDVITDRTWREALGDGRRMGDWTAYFTGQVRERPWRDVLVTWWPRLLPAIMAGATHGVIRVSHAVRALLAGDESAGLPVMSPGPDAVAELVDRAATHGEEHVIKFADTAADAYEHTGDADTLAAALRVGELIQSAN